MMGKATSRESKGSTAPTRVLVLRWARALHGYLSLGLLVLVVVSSITGILLGWKKNAAVLQPPTREAPTAPLSEWRPLADVAATAREALARARPDAPTDALVPDRMDVRPGDGIVKVLFPSQWEVQVEGVSGRVRSVARRHSDWIETLHDGSILGDGFKLATMTILGLGLLFLSATGFWMWYGPRRLRRLRRPTTPSRRRAA